jgi:gluconolactonase
MAQAHHKSISMLEDPRPIGHGLGRPEDVAITRAGRVFASDRHACVSEIRPDNTLRRIGTCGGEPNGLNLTVDTASMWIANFARHVLERPSLRTGDLEVSVDTVEGRPLKRANYPVLLRDGTVICSSSTQHDEPLEAIVSGASDGAIFSVRPNGHVELLADGVVYPTGLAVGPEERYLYCCRTSLGDVVRFR